MVANERLLNFHVIKARDIPIDSLITFACGCVWKRIECPPNESEQYNWWVLILGCSAEHRKNNGHNVPKQMFNLYIGEVDMISSFDTPDPLAVNPEFTLQDAMNVFEYEFDEKNAARIRLDIDKLNKQLESTLDRMDNLRTYVLKRDCGLMIGDNLRVTPQFVTFALERLDNHGREMLMGEQYVSIVSYDMDGTLTIAGDGLVVKGVPLDMAVVMRAEWLDEARRWS